MAGEPTIQQQDDRRVPSRRDAQGMVLGEMPPAVYGEAPVPESTAAPLSEEVLSPRNEAPQAVQPAYPENLVDVTSSRVMPSHETEQAVVPQPAAEFAAAPEFAYGAESAYNANPAYGAEPADGVGSAYNAGTAYNAESAYNANPAYDAEPTYNAASAYGANAESSQGVGPAVSAEPVVGEPAYGAASAVGVEQPVEPIGAAPAYDVAPASEPLPTDNLAYGAEPAAAFGTAPVQPVDSAQPPTQVPTSAPQQAPIQVHTITVRTGRLVCDIEIHDVKYRYTTPRLSAFANGQYPDLPHHACVNDLGNTFGYVMEKTSVAHLLEHVTISEQVRNQTSGSATFVGTTEWIDEMAGLARIEVGFKDDLVALRAFNEATRFLNMAVLTCLV